MTPAQKERAREFAAMPAEQKLIVKNHAAWMQQLPQDRRVAVRREINSLQQLSPEELELILRKESTPDNSIAASPGS